MYKPIVLKNLIPVAKLLSPLIAANHVFGVLPQTISLDPHADTER